MLVLFLDRFDRRIRSRKDAEKSFGLPVLAEIPRLKRVRRRHRELVVVAQPRSHAADAFRITATMVEMMVIKGVPPSAGPDGNGLEGNGHHDGPIVLDPSRGSRILIVSAGPEEGKTFVAANLAAALGIRGDRVTVIGCDLRRPRIHRLFGAGNAWGLTDVLGPEPTPPLVFQRTAVEGVQLVSSGPPTDGTARLLGSPKLPQVLEAAQARSDVVLIDTAPLLTTADAGELVRHADGVVIVARAGRTTAEVAERTTELLKRLGAPLLGVVLNVTSEMSVPRRYYSYRSYRRPRRSDRGKPQLVSHSLKG